MAREVFFRPTAVVCTLMMWASMAAANDLSFYVGASGGISDLDIKKENVAQVDVNGIDDSSAGWKAFLGMMAPFDNGAMRGSFAMEFSYVDLGEVEARVDPVTAGSPTKVTADFEAYGISAILGVGLWKGVTILGKVGWFYGETDSDPDGQPGIAFTDFDTDEGDDGVHYGIGLTYAVTEHLDLRMDWDRYDIFNLRIFGVGEDSDPDFFSIGLQFRF